MLVCSCNVITRFEIESAIISILDEDAWQLITPGVVYRALAQRGKCTGCFPNVIDIIIETVGAYHLRIASPEDKVVPLIRKIRAEHERCETVKKLVAAKRAKVA